jgi:CheY-like chemotaxis protein
MEGLVNSLLSFLRGGKAEVQTLNLQDVLADLASVVQATVRDAGADFHITPVDRSLTLRGCRDDLVGALANLVVNAIESVGADAAVTLWAGAVSTTALQLRVRDNGPGVADDIADRIFDPFFTTKSVGEGTGLGLPSVHAIVRSLGGDISVYSELGKGTTFRIYLPTAALSVSAPVVTAAEAAGSSSAGPAAATAMRTAARILLVDDEQTILDTTARFLERAGHSVARAGDGIEGRDLFDAAPGAFDLLVTDLTMPGCSGEELIEHVHGRRPEMPAILTSGFGGHSLVVDELESQQLVTYLDKPFRQAELLERVEAAMTRHGAGTRSNSAEA